MEEGSPLVLSFDEISDQPKNYYYSIILCNGNWTESRLSPSEYSSGLFSYPVSNYQASFNTEVHYVHYEIELPGNDLLLTLSGNYLIKVFENSDSDNPVLIKRFVLADKKIEIIAETKIPTLPEYRATSHQLNFSILHTDFPISNPYNEISVVITKNFDWNTSLSSLKPLFIKNGILDYNYDKENVFIAGNEFRSFNINSRKYPSPQVVSFDDDNTSYTANLAKDKPRNNYFFKEDINGLFVIENKDLRNPDNSLEADYFRVKFSLQANIVPADGDIFIYGALTNYSFTEENRLNYNEAENIYEASLFLKQGYYDYQYVLIPKNKNSFDESEIEGSFFETENNFFIFVYYRGFGMRYDKLIGYKRVVMTR